jgi:SAM-dependent methyltransferase
MTKQENNSFTSYLQAKKSVDDRALNLRVWEKLKELLEELKAVDQKLRVLEIGGGIGVMLARMLEDDLLPNCDYCLLDNDPENIAAAPDYLVNRAIGKNFTVDKPRGNTIRIKTPLGAVNLDLVCDDLYTFTEEKSGIWDLVVAHAVLDLFDLETALRRLASVTRPGGLLYLTINYDGHTIFEPSFDSDFEERLLQLYNQSMDNRVVDGTPSGDSRSGRHLFAQVRRLGLEILGAGSSDWVVYPSSQGYPEDEADFLVFILETIYRQLKGHPAVNGGALDQWIGARKKQVESEELVLIIHQLDCLVRR